jgi:hypothetical protein
MNVKAPQSTSAQATSLNAPHWPGGIAPASLLPGEDEAGYAGLSAHFVAAVKPIDFVERLLLRDAIDLTWDILRLRRMKAGLLRVAAGKGVRKILSTSAMGTLTLTSWKKRIGSPRSGLAEKPARAENLRKC